MSQQRFNIRVYGILKNTKNEVLLSDERRFGITFTKFPGGGLHWGEGLEDAVVREFQEEIGIEVQVLNLFYVNPFYQVSAFNADDQLLSFYYQVTPKDWAELDSILANQNADNEEFFRWRSIAQLDENTFRFPIDKIVGELLSAYSSNES